MRMSQTDTQVEVTILQELVSEFNIVLYNDDVNTFDHVINCLVRICDHEPMQAEQCAWIVHLNGKCAVKNGVYDELEPLCHQLLDNGLSVKLE
jgi:ATP-dependent Clp protease adaptor protein ClpS